MVDPSDCRPSPGYLLSWGHLCQKKSSFKKPKQDIQHCTHLWRSPEPAPKIQERRAPCLEALPRPKGEALWSSGRRGLLLRRTWRSARACPPWKVRNCLGPFSSCLPSKLCCLGRGFLWRRSSTTGKGLKASLGIESEIILIFHWSVNYCTSEFEENWSFICR